MHAIPQADHVSPDWRTLAEQRLQLSMLLSAVVLLGLLSILRFPMPGPLPDILELVIEITAPPRRREDVTELPEPESPATETPATESAADEGRAGQSPADSESEASAVPEPLSPDWEALREEAIISVLDAAEKEASWSVNPPLERARREARVRFRASRAPKKEHAWDHVERDQVGRTVLRVGNCYQVLDDPRVTNRWAYETFDKHLVYCGTEGGSAEPPSIGAIPDRYEYLDEMNGPGNDR
jgi:hypothetical protein